MRKILMTSTMRKILIACLLAIVYLQNVSAQVDTQHPQGERPRGEAPGRPPHGGKPGRPPGMGKPGVPGSRQTDIKYSGSKELTAEATETGKTYQSEKTDESALLISTKEAVTLSQPTISKTGSSDGGDNCSFYGVNAALLIKGGSTTTIKGGVITSDGTGANGVFSYGGNGGHNGR